MVIAPGFPLTNIPFGSSDLCQVESLVEDAVSKVCTLIHKHYETLKGLLGSCFRKLLLRTIFENTKNTKKRCSLKTLISFLNLMFFMFFIKKQTSFPCSLCF